MRRGVIIAIAILTAYALLVVCADNALSAAVSCEHRLIVTECVDRKERQRERRSLRQRYLAWRQWRKDDIRRRIHRWAINELGNGYARYAPSGLPWCALFAAFCVSKGQPCQLLPANPASTSSWRAAIRNEVRGLREVVERHNVKPGDVVTFPYGHTGIVHRATSHGFYSIEGNCSGLVRLRFHRWGEADTFGRALVRYVPARFRPVLE